MWSKIAMIKVNTLINVKYSTVCVKHSSALKQEIMRMYSKSFKIFQNILEKAQVYKKQSM